ncbi:hypothetical protein PAXRUDRAFT_827529 [Paxillus rubicundulus Ve08.2h10]|uniref:Uncharacterized protein n=1 Tax=Paxillus rubicundulus Ve08.2h10 TaxID=930991 RepID=A0A0D0DXT4_9AGAM|nr:hypothetical protein PAXRUDRAFT_827529 [Paxillus rubicundulus Ve08.2h10]
MYHFPSQPAFSPQSTAHANNYSTGHFIDPALIDPALEPYRRQPMDTSTRSLEPGLALNYTYLDTSYVPSHHMAQLHSPVPLHLSHSLPHSDALRHGQATPITNAFPTVQTTASTAPSMLEYYAAAPQLLFPTPSELLTDLASVSPSSHHRQPSHQHDLPEMQSHTQSPPLPQTSRQQTPEDTSAVLPSGAANKTESQRKARQRAVAEEIGFTPTDPDTISSHEKKRHYLECLEQYVLYLHEQLRLVQTLPLALERVSTYRGLSSRSIRTLLVYMQNTNKNLHESTLVEERVFLDLSTQVMAAHNAGLPLRRHSVDVVGMSSNLGYSNEPCLGSLDSVSPLASQGTSTSPSPSPADGTPGNPVDAAMVLGGM